MIRWDQTGRHPSSSKNDFRPNLDTLPYKIRGHDGNKDKRTLQRSQQSENRFDDGIFPQKKNKTKDPLHAQADEKAQGD